MMWLAMWQFTSCAQTSQKKQIMNTKKILVAFFSRAGENYEVGYIEKGNTHILAEMIAAKTGGTLFHIEPVRPYPEDYTECIKVAKTELHNQARPAVKGDVAVEDYDVIFIGYPTGGEICRWLSIRSLSGMAGRTRRSSLSARTKEAGFRGQSASCSRLVRGLPYWKGWP